MTISTVEPDGLLPTSAPVDWSNPDYDEVKVSGARTSLNWTAAVWRRSAAPGAPTANGWMRPSAPRRSWTPFTSHIWDAVNAHLGTNAHSFPELVEQLGIMRFGHRPRVADTFCGSGQIPFEAARLGCDVYASDLNPVACMLTWGAFHIVGGSAETPRDSERSPGEQRSQVQERSIGLGVETDGQRLAGQGVSVLSWRHVVRRPAGWYRYCRLLS